MKVEDRVRIVVVPPGTKVAGGGAIQLTGKAGPINPTDSAMTRVNASLKVAQLDLAGSGLSDFAPDVAGLVSFEGAGSSDGRIMQVGGKLKAEKLKLAKKGTSATRPVEFDFAARHDLRKHSGTLRQGDIHIGGASAPDGDLRRTGRIGDAESDPGGSAAANHRDDLDCMVDG